MMAFNGCEPGAGGSRLGSPPAGSGPVFGMKPPILSTATVTVSADVITAGSAGSGYLEIEELVENSRIHSIY